MASFRKQKIKALRFGVPLLLFAVSSVLPLFTSSAPVSAATYPAPNNPGTNNIVVTIQNGKFDEPAFRGYTVTATRVQAYEGGGNNLNFTYQPNGALGDNSLGEYLSDNFMWVDPQNCTSATNAAIANKNRFAIVVKKDGKQVGSGQMDGCGKPYLNTFSQITIPVNDSAPAPGSLSGYFKYISAEDGSEQPVKSTAKGTLVCSDNQTRNVSFDDNGHYSVTNLPPGECTLNASYTSTDTNAKTYFIVDKKFKIESGKDTNGDAKGNTGTDIPDPGQTNCTPDPNNPNACSASEDRTLKCGGGDWDWAICPFIMLAQESAIKIDGFITNLLNIDAKLIFDNRVAPGKAYYAAWNTFRIMATALILIAGLVMVISQALGFDFLDAYTIRKVLPRLVVAVIGISLSWPLMAFFVNLFNTIGYDIRSLIYAPFKNLGGGINPAVGIASYLAPLIGGAILTGLGLLSLIGTALLAMLVAFVILVLRQLAIVVFVILAPVAIACYILPNTHKGWKLWYDSFLGILLMFPIISAFIAAGHVFAAVALSPGAGGSQFGSNTLAQIIGITAYFIPYFLLPIAFRLATGLVSTLAGFVNDRSKGGFDRLKKFRSAKTAESLAGMKAGTRFNNRGLNAMTSRATTRNLGFGRRGKAAYNQKLDLAAMNEAKSPGGMAVQHNDGALQALTYASAEEARRNMANDFRDAEGNKLSATEVNNAIAAAKASGGFGRARQVWAAQQLSNTGTGYQTQQQLAQTIARVSHGNENQIASLAGNINSSTKSAGRHDLAPGFAALNQLALQEGKLRGGAPQYGQAQENAWNSASLYQHGNDKGQNMKSAVAHYSKLLTHDDWKERQKAAVFFHEIDGMQANASGDVKNIIQGALADNRDDINNLYKIGDPAQGIPAHGNALPTTPTDEIKIATDNAGNWRSETGKERVARVSRSYERPNPNHLT